MIKQSLLILLLPYACWAQDFKWLNGIWKENNGKSMEAWTVAENRMNGTGYKLMPDGSKKISEEMSVIKKGNDYYFISDIEGPQAAIEFKITSRDKDSFVAENLNHDFPKRIVYKRMDQNHLQAFISDGDITIIRFYFTKVND